MRSQDFWGWFQSLHSDAQLSLIGVVLVALVVITAFVCLLINSIHRRRTQTELKRELLERGMSAEEIARVIESALPTRKK